MIENLASVSQRLATIPYALRLLARDWCRAQIGDAVDLVVAVQGPSIAGRSGPQVVATSAPSACRCHLSRVDRSAASIEWRPVTIASPIKSGMVLA